jgi:hypothetical protein
VFGALSVIAIAVICAFAASFVIWRAASRSGLFALLAGVALTVVVLVFAILIGYAMTRAWLPQ